MKNLHEVLYAFFSQFSHDGKPIPAYYAGMVPDDAVFPYVTFSVSRGEAFSQGINTVFFWFRREGGKSPMPKIASVLDKVAEAIPAGGVLLKVDGGCAAIYRNGSDWLTYMQDTEDAEVWGGRVSYQINYYM